MRVLVAFDKFKGCLSAREACRIAAEAIRAAAPDSRPEEIPLTDGGEGFAELLTLAAGGELKRCTVSGPLGEPASACWGLVSLADLPVALSKMLDLPNRGKLAVVEMAQASGLQLLAEQQRNPWRTSSRGTGELLRQAAAAGPAGILLGIGGSATHDLGLGALQALGFSDGTAPAALLPERWPDLRSFSGAVTERLPPIIIASDVENPLLGERGAARVFAPQKGLPEAEIDRLEQLTGRTGRLLCQHFGAAEDRLAEPGSGAAGGIGFGLRLACGARMVPGFALVRAWMGLDRKLREADLVVTGEGCFDASSLEGKGPGALVKEAVAAGTNCLLLAGRIELPAATRESLSGCRFVEVTPRAWPFERAISEAGRLLKEAVQRETRSLR